jgi:predicted Zn finger-like uncharacterized protein
VEITCDRCRRSYFVPDDLVHGRTLRARCAPCGHAFVVEVGARHAVTAAPRPPVASRPPVPSPTVSALPGLAEDVEGHLGWLDEAAARAEAAAAEDREVLLTVQRSRRSTATALAAGAAVVLAAGGGLAWWASSRAHPAAAVREPTRPATPATLAAGGVAGGTGGTGGSGGSGGPVHDVEVLARPAPAALPAAAAEPAPAPVPAPARRRSPPHLARHDRRLLDLLARKQDAVAVPIVDDEGAGAARSALDPDAAGRVVARHRKAFDTCISRAVRRRPGGGLARRATLVVTVEPAGTVARAWVLEEEVDRSDLGACLATAARRMVFPAFDGEPLDVAVPLSLSAVY